MEMSISLVVERYKNKQIYMVYYPVIKAHHYIIYFVWSLHSKAGTENYCLSNTDLLSW